MSEHLRLQKLALIRRCNAYLVLVIQITMNVKATQTAVDLVKGPCTAAGTGPTTAWIAWTTRGYAAN
jgi:hypothetical protein